MEKFLKGKRVMVEFGENTDHKHYKKYNGKKGFIERIECKWNPIPIVKFDDGKMLPIEGKYLLHLQQVNLFAI